MAFLKSIRNNWIFISQGFRTLRLLDKIRQNPTRTILHIVADHVKSHGDQPAILFENRAVSYKELNQLSDQYAHWARNEAGIRKGDAIALLMENRPEFIIAWMGILKAGGIAALINTNLTQKSLAHCINISEARHIVLGAEMAENFSTAADLLENKPQIWATGGDIQGAEKLDEKLKNQPAKPFAIPQAEQPAHKDNAFYIYTSGTTGNPKAAKISHYRMLNMMVGFTSGTGATRKDRVYVTLPLYHSAGGVCSVGMGLVGGGTLIIKRKFSASAFWQDVHHYQATIFQYIGELCRYLLNAPPHPKERAHRLRVAIGNGLRPDIWEEFQQRFQIPRIIEFYGATEGNLSLINFDGTVGAVGRLPQWARGSVNMELVRFNMEKEEPLRDTKGRCIPCQAGEIGELIGEIILDDPAKAITRFEGYVGEKETRKKILRDVKEQGDQWFRTGDLLKFDEKGYFYFIDRIGDTFRWKGENVSTAEVAEAISVFPGIAEANVYGVAIPGADGRAGMAAIVNKDKRALDLEKFSAHLKTALPAYAAPLFLRILPEMEITGTFKHRKVDLVKEGFDPEKIADPLYFHDPRSDRYVPLSAALHQEIARGMIRL